MLLPIDTLTHKSTLLFIDFYVCPACFCVILLNLCLRNLGTRLRSSVVRLLFIYLNLCDLNEIGSLFAGAGHHSVQSMHQFTNKWGAGHVQQFINRLKMFSFSACCILDNESEKCVQRNKCERTGSVIPNEISALGCGFPTIVREKYLIYLMAIPLAVTRNKKYLK